MRKLNAHTSIASMLLVSFVFFLFLLFVLRRFFWDGAFFVSNLSSS